MGEMFRILSGGLILVLAASPAVAGAHTGPSQEAVTANELGIAHLTAGRSELAIDSFRAARKLLPAGSSELGSKGISHKIVSRNLAAALSARAVREIQGRKPDTAIAHHRDARKWHPERVRYRILLARA